MEKIGIESLKKYSEFDNHKSIYIIENHKANLYGYIAIHNDNLGPAVGGTRFFPYISKEDALRDVLQLSRAMTYKCALANVKYGGGKGVIIGDPKKIKTQKLLEAYAKEIDNLKGKFFTGEDVGMTKEDIQFMLKISSFFIGKEGRAGDPSPYAALSTFHSMQATLRHLFGTEKLIDRVITIKGLGKVGKELARLILEAGGRVVGADVDPSVIREIKKKFPLIIIEPSEKIHKIKADIYAPCALGNEFTEGNMQEIQSRIICGGANNQLSSPGIGDWFFRNGITYIPDYIVNAGGLIDVVDELESGGYNHARVLERIKNIQITIENLLTRSDKEKRAPNKIADELVEKIVEDTV